MNAEQLAALDKIKKLLRMKRGGTPDEIATALRLAQDIAEKHGINLADVNPDDEQRERPISHEDEILGSRIQWECKYAMLIVSIFFNVSGFLSMSYNPVRRARVHQIVFVGTEWDRQIAIYVYRFLVGAMRRAWKDKSGRCRNRQAFLYGFYIGLHAKLRARQPKPVDAPGIVLVNQALERRDAYIAKQFGALRDVDTAPEGDAEAAKRAGYRAGLDTEIRSGLAGSAGRKAIGV